MFTEDEATIKDIPSKLLSGYNNDTSMSTFCMSLLNKTCNSRNVARKSITSISSYENDTILVPSFSWICMEVQGYVHLYPHFYIQPVIP